MGRQKNRDPLAVEIGRRIGEAWKAAGFPSLTAMQRASSIDDYNQLAKWARGEHLPSIAALAEIARVCQTSLDWLVRGEEHAPPAFLEWLQTPAGQAAEPEARAFLRSMPTQGYVATLAFYDLALQAWRLGLQRELGDDFAQGVRDTERKTDGKPRG